MDLTAKMSLTSWIFFLTLKIEDRFELKLIPTYGNYIVVSNYKNCKGIVWFTSMLDSPTFQSIVWEPFDFENNLSCASVASEINLMNTYVATGKWDQDMEEKKN